MLQQLSQNRFIPKLLIITILYVSTLSAANAAMITSAELVHEQQLQLDRDRLQRSLDRDDVATALEAHGVDSEMAKLRVASMTAEEIQLLNQKMDELPAGAGIVELAVLVFLVLLFTDIMGYTDIFPFVNKPAK